jgi:recombinational DNA repair protein (RecF pathway)
MMEPSPALILKTAPYSETTLLVTLLTRGHGVVRVLAKGARSGRQMQAAFEPFAWIEGDLRVVDGEKLGRLFSPRLIEGWPYLRTDLERLAFAGVGLEAGGLLAEHSPADPFHFEEAVRFLTALRDAPGPGSLLIAALLRLLHYSGFPPQLAEPWTAQTLPPVLTYHFDQGLFAAPGPHDSSHAMRLPQAALAPLLPFMQTPPPLDGSLCLGGAAGVAALRWLIRVWEDHLNQPLHSAQYLEKMVLRVHD